MSIKTGTAFIGGGVGGLPTAVGRGKCVDNSGG